MSDQSLIAANAARWQKAKATRDFSSVARKLVLNKDRYQAIAKNVLTPWWAIAVIHEREASGDFSRNIAQGDPWNQVSTHVPKGRGPFSSFEAAAKDALLNCDPRAGTWTDWSPGGTFTILEKYNGLGYANRGLPSPYIWSGTDQYVKGKYVADDVFDPNAVDQQLGCAGLVMAMRKIDPSIKFADEKPPVVQPKHAAGIAAIVAAIAAALQAHSTEVIVGVLVAGVVVALLLHLFWPKK